MTAYSAAEQDHDRDHLDLRSRREELGLAVHRVAADLGVHPSTVLRWERGDRLPGPDAVRGLSRALGTDTGTVAAYFDARRPPPDAPQRVRATGLRELRRRHAWSASRIADQLGVPVSTVYNWESGRSGMPVELVSRLADELLPASAAPPAHQLVTAVLRRPATPAPRAGGPLRTARVRRGWSQQRLAEEVRVTRHLVGAWERGQVPGLAQQRRLAAALGLEVVTVAGWYDTPVPVGLRPRSWRPGDLPRVLRDLRTWSGLRQRDVARHCDRSTETVRAWEAGRTVPSASSRDLLTTLYRLPAGALDTALPGPTPDGRSHR